MSVAEIIQFIYAPVCMRESEVRATSAYYRPAQVPALLPHDPDWKVEPALHVAHALH